MMLGNSKWENAQFNSRLQPIQLGLGTSANAQDLWKVDYDYGTTDNNGNVKQQTITVPTINPLVQNYTYDSLNRIKSATETENSNQTWKQTFTYDRYGNRNFDAANTTTLGSCSTVQCNPQVDASNNRFTTNQGYTYDLSGNLLTDAQNRNFVYDAENKQKEVKDASTVLIGTYFYDGDGKRVRKVSASENTIFVYDASGILAAEYILTESTPTIPTTSYLTNDNLGSPRITTDSSGNVLSRRDFMPFGEDVSGVGGRNQPNGYQSDAIRQKFTGYQRDAESDLDFAQARMYNKNHGRFTSVDPGNLQAMLDITMPQSWNAYAYVNNQPTKVTDPTGRCGTWKIWQCIANRAAYGKGRFKSDDEIQQIADGYREEFKKNLLEYGGEYVRGRDWSQVDNGTIIGMYDGLLENGVTVPDNAVEVQSTPDPINLEPPDIVVPIEGGTRRTNPNDIRAKMPKAPEFLQRVGRAIKWGNGEAGAIERIRNITRSDVVNSGVTRAEAEASRDFYRGAAKADPLNKAAPARAELMQKVVDFLK